ncbi:unnamed protein product, partial [Sphacelaria rigidula]
AENRDRQWIFRYMIFNTAPLHLSVVLGACADGCRSLGQNHANLHTSEEHEYDSWHSHSLGCSLAVKIMRASTRVIARDARLKWRSQESDEQIILSSTYIGRTHKSCLLCYQNNIHECTRFDE